jgi:hypothetical protein
MIKSNELVIKTQEQLSGERGNFEKLWQDIGDYVLPRKNDINSFKTPGTNRNILILDNTAMTSLELLAGHLHGIVTSASNPFFEFTTGDFAVDNRDDVRKWMQDTVDRMHMALNNSNFQTEVHELYLDLCGFNTAAMSILEDSELDFVFKTHFLKEIYIKENNKGLVDQVYRRFEWEARKIIEEYGEKNCPPSVIDAWKSQKPEQKFEIIHAVYPQDPLGEKKKGFRFPIVSHHVLVKDKFTLKLHGFNEAAWVVPRWAKASGEDYGRGPGINSLPEVRMINLMEEVVIKSAQLAFGPPVQAPDDGFIGGIKIKPYGISYYRSGSNRTDRIEQLFDVPRVDFSAEIMAQRRQRIKEAYYVDQLQTREADRQTTVEVMQRREEQMRFLGPLSGRLNTEFLSPLVDRVFGIMSRRNRFLPPPAVIQGKKLSVKYSSAIARVQRMTEANSTFQFLANIAPLAQINPAVLQNIDTDAAFRGIAPQFSFPQRYIRDQDVVDNMRAEAAKVQEEQMQMQKDLAQTEMVKNAAPAIGMAQEQMAEEEI